MRLHRIELCGFKSFVDPTTITLDRQVTAVVGPNGCGKSNILDAIRWAMGEQSARALRGKAMEEIIFAGSETRGSASVAEVTLTFDNSEGRIHHDYAGFTEISVTRRLSRDGVSEYFINGTPCRMRDVVELLLSAGVSPRSSMVEQGRMGLIVTARPEERRLLIEEAAGIAKYRIHRRATQRKIDQTKQNLLRVSDVVAEMKRSLSSLKRQAAKAKRFVKLRDEQAELELRVATHRWLELEGLRRRREADLVEEERALREAEELLVEREESISRRRAAQREAEERLEAAQTEVYRRTNEVQQTRALIEQLERQLAVERRAEAEAELRSSGIARRLAETEAELSEARSKRDATGAQLERSEEALRRRQGRLAEARTSRAAVEARLERCRQRIARASAQRAAGARALDACAVRHQESTLAAEELGRREADLRRRIVEVEAEVETLSEVLLQTKQRVEALGDDREAREKERDRLVAALREAEERRDEVGRNLTRCRSRLQSLEEIAGRYENYGQGVRDLMRRPAVSERTLAIVADVIDCPSNLEPALAAVLGERLQDLVVDDLSSAAEIASIVTADGLGRVGVVPSTPRRVGLPAVAAEGNGVVGVFADMVGCARRWEPLVRQLLSGVVVVETLADATRLWSEHGGELTWVTKAGEVVSPSGRTCAGRDEVGLALLQTKREIRRLSEQAEVLEQDHEQRSTVVAQLRAELSATHAAIEDLRRDAHRGDLELVQQQKDLSRSRDEGTRLGRELERLEQESKRLSKVLDQCVADRDRIRQEIADAEQEEREATAELAAEQKVLEERRADEERALAATTEVRVEAASGRERLEALSQTCARLEGECDDLRRRGRRLIEDRTRAAAAQGRIGGELFAAREGRGAVEATAEEAREKLEEAKAALDRLRAGLARDEAEVHDARKKRDALKEAVQELRLASQEARLGLESLLDRVRETRSVDLLDMIIDYHCTPPATEEDLARIEELRRAIERIGSVNLTAVEEYEELLVRYEEATAQQEDLEASLGHLQRAIQKLNREGRRRFKETFDEVSQHFQTIFPRLFEGGRAKLVLTDENDLLETGVDIIAQPPGKKLGRMELMSGGEKALTAVSLIFALFKASPSPFTILDEVDAPFDDANVRRYLEMLREMASESQFVLVTHSKLSMAESDVLYGVTMEEPGVSKMVSVRLKDDREEKPEVVAA